MKLIIGKYLRKKKLVSFHTLMMAKKIDEARQSKNGLSHFA